MSHTNEESYETIGLIPSIAMIVGVFLVAIFPVIVQVALHLV